MTQPAHRKLLRDAAAEHQRVCRRAETVSARDAAAVLNLGSVVLLHALLEESEREAFKRFIDPSVQRRLRREHREIGEHLALLEQLIRGEPDSPDLMPLCEAVLRRLRDHLEHDGRLFYRPTRWRSGV